MTSVAVGLSRDLAAKRVMRADVGGQDIAVWRDSQGGLHAWDNRCPHRGMRLSHGFVRGDALACLYHGWQYGTTGRCAYIPAHPDLEPPETIHAQVYQASEQGGVIWVSLNAEAQAPKGPEMAPLRSLAFACDERAVVQAFAATAFQGAMPKAQDHGHFELGAHRMQIFTNPMADETLVHILVNPETTLTDRKAVSRWAEAARAMAEEAARQGEPCPTRAESTP